MSGFRPPGRRPGGGIRTYLFLDANQVVQSLSEFEGGIIDELKIRSETVERSSNVEPETGASHNARMRREEEVLSQRTGYSRVRTLLDQLREMDLIGSANTYSPEFYEAMREGDLYEFKAEIRLHPFHQFVAAVQSVEQFGRDWGASDDDDMSQVRREAEDAFYGKDRTRGV